MKSVRAGKAQKSAQREGNRLAKRTGTYWKPLPEMGKEAALRAMVDELGLLGCLPQIVKTAVLEDVKEGIQDVGEHLTKDVTAREAMGAGKRLKKLERQKVTPGEIARSALAGAAAGMTGSAVRETVAGKPLKAIKGALKTPGVGKKVLRLGGAGLRGMHGMLGTAAGSAALVTAAPFIRRHLHQEAEKETLRQYLGQSPHGKERGAVKRHLGI